MQIKVAKIDRQGQPNWESRELSDVAAGEVTVKTILESLTKAEVKLYNQGISKKLPEFIALGKAKGAAKLSWPWRKTKKIEVKEAQEQTVLAFSDGLIVIFVDQNKYDKLDANINIKENSELMIVKLTFIATGYDIANWV